MCNCDGVKVGSYDNQTEVPFDCLPEHMREYTFNRRGFNSSICIDTCLLSDIFHLRIEGITTTGCCCGHNVLPGYIGVIEQDIPRMIKFGYHIDPRTNIPGNFIFNI